MRLESQTMIWENIGPKSEKSEPRLDRNMAAATVVQKYARRTLVKEAANKLQRACYNRL